MPSIKVVPKDDSSRVGYEHLSAAFGAGAPATLQVTAPRSARAAVVAGLEDDPGIASVAAPVAGAGDAVLIGAVPTSAAASADFGDTVERLRDDAAPGRAGRRRGRREPRPRVGAGGEGAAGDRASSSALGFLLLLIAFQAPLVAAIAVLANLLSTAAAFGVAKLIFQDGHLSGLLGFESQGFLDAWGPIFFFAMIFAIAMDYTVFLLSSAREQLGADGRREGGDDRRAGPTRGASILAAGAVMVAVFFTFALSGPLPPKEMGVILGVAVLLDTFLGPPAAAAGVPAARRSVGLVDALLAEPHPARRPFRARRLAKPDPHRFLKGKIQGP